MQKVIFRNPDGSVGVITPTEDALKKFGIDAIAKKDVPDGLPYKIVNASDIPEDRTWRDCWEWDTTVKPDGVGAVSNTFEGVLE